MSDDALPEPDREAATAFWARYVTRGGDIGAFSDVVQFGDSVTMANELLDLVLNGPKRATAGSVVEYEAEGAALPRVGDRWIACDGQGAPRAVLRTTDAFVAPLSAVDDQFAYDEGEGDRTRDDWLRGHTKYFVRRFAELGVPFHPEIELCFERFELLYQEPASAS